MSQYAKTHPDEFPRTSQTTDPYPDSPELTPAETAHIINEIRKWGCPFDGKDSFSFLKRVEELSLGYGYTDEQLLRSLPELLKGESLLWYRNKKNEWGTWTEFTTAFRNHYLPWRYLTQLRREIQGRRQKEGEPFTRYLTDVLTKMRRASGYKSLERIEQIYENMHPEYKLYVRLADITSMQKLTSLATEYEQILKEKRELRVGTEETRRLTLAAAAYTREDCCWRCTQRGHTRIDCRRLLRKFCSQCGRDGVLTRDCHPRPGNDERAEPGLGETRPTPQPASLINPDHTSR